MSRVLIVGAGDLGLKLAAGLLERGLVSWLTLADAKPAAASPTIDMLSCCYDATLRLVELDGRDAGAVTALLRDSRPDVIVQAASLVGPWAIIGREHPAARALAKAGIGVQLPAQLPVLTTVMTAVRELGLTVPVANVSVPDIAHPILAKWNLAPTIGLGNASILHLRARAALRQRLRAEGGNEAEPPLLRVIGHHQQVYGVMQARRPADPDLAVRVHLGEEGRRDDGLAYEGPACAPGPLYNVITAAAALPVIAALLPGASPLRFSAPSPQGLPGGYPVRIENGDVSLDLPPGVELDEAVDFNRRLGELDGIAEIEADGRVHFTESAQEAVAGLDPRLAEPLQLDDLTERSRLLCEVVAGIG